MRNGPWRTLALAAVTLAVSGCTVINDIRGSEKRTVYQYEARFTVSDPTFRNSLDNFGMPMLGGNSAELLENGVAIFPAMTREIREAKRSVNLETYIFQPDEAGRQFADALIAAARRGVEVRLLVDAWGSKLKALGNELKAAGVRVRKYRPLRLFSIYKVGKRTHRKILVVDGRVAYTGGLGIERRWLGNASSPKEWRDTQVRVVGPVAEQMQSIFAEDWTYTTGEILAGDQFYPAREVRGGGPIQTQAIKVSRGDASSLAKMLYYLAIESSKKTIYIQNAYFLPDKQVRDSLIRAVRRGVRVEVMVPGRHIDVPMVRSASWLHYGELLKGGVKIYEYLPTMLHNKVFVVDGQFATIGSINFDARSMMRNAEESLAFYDLGFGEKVEAMFQRDKKKCEEITWEKWDKRGLARRLAELVFWIWEPYY